MPPKPSLYALWCRSVLHREFKCNGDSLLAVLSSPASPEGRLSESPVRAIDTLLSIVGKEGTVDHRYPTSPVMFRGPEAARNVADAVHHFCLLHGRHPSVIDHALSRAPA